VPITRAVTNNGMTVDSVYSGPGLYFKLYVITVTVTQAIFGGNGLEFFSRKTQACKEMQLE
jgi:hypothetical protein